MRLVRSRASLSIVGLIAAAFLHGSALAIASSPYSDRQWPEGTEVLSFENLDGIILIKGTVRGNDGRDSSGWFVLDTGAGQLALDSRLAAHLGITKQVSTAPIGITDQPLPRLVIGSLTVDQVSPVLTFDAEIVRRAADRAVLGLIGQSVVRDRAVFINYQAQTIALVPSRVDAPADDSTTTNPARAPYVPPTAVGVPFRLAEDGKALVRVRVTGPHRRFESGWLTFALDTGASKCVLFDEAVASADADQLWEPSLEGLVAPTLMGKVATRLARAERIDVGGYAGAQLPVAPAVGAPQVDIAVLSSPLSGDLSRVAGEPVHGLLGYSFLRRFRSVCDYPNQMLWLDPVTDFRDDRPYEHTHAGLQLERDGDKARVAAVASDSPGARSGIRPGDEIVAINGKPTSGSPVSSLARLMEGPPGTQLTITIRRGEVDTIHKLRRRRLL